MALTPPSLPLSDRDRFRNTLEDRGQLQSRDRTVKPVAQANGLPLLSQPRLHKVE